MGTFRVNVKVRNVCFVEKDHVYVLTNVWDRPVWSHGVTVFVKGSFREDVGVCSEEFYV